MKLTTRIRVDISIGVIFFVIVLFPAQGVSSSSEGLFSFEIVGTLSDWWLIPEPEPHDHTQTITHPITDVAGVKTLAIRLTYNGSTACHITKISVWQEISTYGKAWNWAGTAQITPTGEFSPGATFNFLVEAPMYSFLANGIIYLKLVTIEVGDLVLFSEMPKDLDRLNTWPPLTPTSTISTQSTNFTINSNVVGFELLGLICTFVVVAIRRKNS